MSERITRQFQATPAKRGKAPLLIGLVGPSGSGKTYSALRLASGLQTTCPGNILMIDTESNRGLHYAGNFNFMHLPLTAPFGSLDYLDALQFAAAQKPSVIIVDSMSHEHESEGGMLDLWEREITRMAGEDDKKRERMQFLALQKPKQHRRKLLTYIVHQNMNFIFCFRAKSKFSLAKQDGKLQINDMGLMAIGGENFLYEHTVNFLLPRGAAGVPVRESKYESEKEFIKLPRQFSSLNEGFPEPLSEEIGIKLGSWSAGGPSGYPNKDVPGLKEPASRTAVIHSEDNTMLYSLVLSHACKSTKDLRAFWRTLGASDRALFDEGTIRTLKLIAARADEDLNAPGDEQGLSAPGDEQGLNAPDGI